MEQVSINSQWKTFVRYCAQHAKQGIVAELDCGVTVCWTQSTMIFTNGFFFSSAVSEEADLRRRLEGIKAYVTKAQLTFPWIFFIEPELVAISLREQLRNICSEVDLVPFENIYCMQTTSLLSPTRLLPTTEFKFAISQTDVYDAVLLNVQAYSMDESVAENVIEHHALITDFSKPRCCIVAVDGKSVSTSTIYLLDECLYAVLVATSPEHCKLGYAEVALRFCVEHALQTWPHTKHGNEVNPAYDDPDFDLDKGQSSGDF
ncbi:unnamed protein product [Rotaria socialis]|uniref:N-acetyltransferase domain-containing protein n=1 Tax=Rotaria socialis TaxID=392032 RepID=A0A821VZP7_9BILA|nr:unnamed protein product [Rotaria socialis]